MRKKLIISVMILCNVMIFAQNNDNPYAMFGYEPKISDVTHYETELFYLHNNDTAILVQTLAFDFENGKVYLYGVDNQKIAMLLLDKETMARFTTPDPMAEKYPSTSPYAYALNNPIRYTDPTGMWVADENGNLVAEKNDNAWTLAKFQNITPKEAIAQLIGQGYTISDKGILNLKVGDVVTLDNVYTQNLANHGNLPTGNPQLQYNCWGSAIAGVEGVKIQNGVGISTPNVFDAKLQSDFSSVNNSQAQFGQTIIRFAEDKPYQGAMYNDYASQGLVSRNPNTVGGASHGAVYYGTSQNGTVYVYTKNGWYEPPRIMTLQEVIKIYGNVSGLNNGFGYYNKR